MTIKIHDSFVTWKRFPRHCPFLRESTGHRWIPFTKASNQGVFMIHFVLAWTHRSIDSELSVIWDATTLKWQRCNVSSIYCKYHAQNNILLPQVILGIHTHAHTHTHTHIGYPQVWVVFSWLQCVTCGPLFLNDAVWITHPKTLWWQSAAQASKLAIQHQNWPLTTVAFALCCYFATMDKKKFWGSSGLIKSLVHSTL